MTPTVKTVVRPPSEADRDRMAGPERDGTAPVVVIEVEPDGALDLFSIEKNRTAGRPGLPDPLALFTSEAPSIEPDEVIALEASIDAAAEAITARLAAPAYPQPPSRPAREFGDVDLVLSDRPAPLPRITNPIEPRAPFDSRRLWVAAMVVGFLAAAAVPGIAILRRSPAGSPARSAAVAPAVARSPAANVPAREPEPLRPAVEPAVAAAAKVVRGADALRAGVQPPASAPAVTVTSTTTTAPVTSTPGRIVTPPPAPVRTAPVTAPTGGIVARPPAATPAAAAASGLVAPTAPASRTPPESAPSTNSPAAALPAPTAPSPVRVETRAAVPAAIPPSVVEPTATAPPPSGVASPLPPSSSPVPPSALPAAAASAIPLPRATDNDAIQATLSRYRTAYSALDADAAGAVWPSVDQKALGRAFARLEQQRLTFNSCAIDVRGVRAVATCKGTADYVPKVGNKSSRTDSRQWVFNLLKVDDRWLIDGVNSR